ncbi:OmpA family protein [Sedimenticola hydrogenitrophicus]|uniref:OmpA family protein n=1 Tax=Sedimenticola hydrogenitrophicus TaxID=2967975 RepID=UPI0021A85007|nr:OmpA family protein [Sedimenticola hydrogenitrophicus]
MNRSVLFSLLAGVMLSGNAHAYQSPGWAVDGGLEQWRGGDVAGSENRYPGEWQGGGVGAVAGALLAGPPGFIVGAVGGALAGRSAGLESDLHSARQELARLERLHQAEAGRQRQLEERLASAEWRGRQQLQAIAGGFVYRLYFRTGQSVIEADDRLALERLVVALQTLAGLNIEVHAYADRRGSEEGNRALSQARAQAVVEQLLRHGLESGRIVHQAHGEAAARYPAADREGLGYDRQVVIRFRDGAAS